MTNQKHLALLRQGTEVWNKWRRRFLDVWPDLSYANLEDIDLTRAFLVHVDLSFAQFRRADLTEADLSESNLTGADLSETNLTNANLSGAFLNQANLSKAVLHEAILRESHLNGTNFGHAMMGWTTFGDVDLSVVKGLETVQHKAPSYISISSIYRSRGNIPKSFLREAGTPDSFITYMRSLAIQPIDYYTCFISYASQNEDFVQRLYADLQANGVRCWFAPEDMKIGDKIRQRIDESIRLYDKLLLVLSEQSVKSVWVEYEVEAALAKERRESRTVLFPIRLDSAVMESTTAWAAHIKDTRHIGNFTTWKDHDSYQWGLQRLLRDLKTEVPGHL